MKLTVKQRIYNVLMENQNGELNYQEIAERAYGDAFLRETKKYLTGLVKRNISHAIAMLAEDGYIVIRVLEKLSDEDLLKGDTKTSFKKKIKGFKIADKEDIRMVEVNLQRKEQRIESARQIKIDFHKLAEDNKLLNE